MKKQNRPGTKQVKNLENKTAKNNPEAPEGDNITVEFSENEINQLFSVFDSALKYSGMQHLGNVYALSFKIEQIISHKNSKK